MLKAFLIALMIPIVGIANFKAAPADISGTWDFTIEGRNMDPVTGISKSIAHEEFTLKQQGTRLRGSYSGQFGKKTVTGTIKGNNVVLVVGVVRDGQRVKATYNGTIEGQNKMKGALEYVGDPDHPRAQWTATKK
jgi:uncharacterized protein